MANNNLKLPTVGSGGGLGSGKLPGSKGAISRGSKHGRIPPPGGMSNLNSNLGAGYNKYGSGSGIGGSIGTLNANPSISNVPKYGGGGIQGGIGTLGSYSGIGASIMNN